MSADQAEENRKIFKRYIQQAEETAAAGNHPAAADLIRRAMELPGYEYDPEAMRLKRKYLELCDAIGIRDVQQRNSLALPEPGNSVLLTGRENVYAICQTHIYVYDYSGKLIKAAEYSQGCLLCAAVSGDEKVLIIGGAEGEEAQSGQLIVYGLNKEKPLKTIRLNNVPVRISVSGRNDRFAFSCKDGTVEICTLPDCAHGWRKKIGRYPALYWGPDDNTLYAATAEPDLWAVSLRNRLFTRARRICEKANGGSLYYDAVSPDGRMYLRGMGHYEIDCIDTLTAEKRASLYIQSGAVTIAGFSPDSRFAAFGTDNGKVQFRNTGSLKKEGYEMVFDKCVINDIRWCPDSTVLVVKSRREGGSDDEAETLHFCIPDWEYRSDSEQNTDFFEEHRSWGRRLSAEELGSKYWAMYEHLYPEVQEMALKHEFFCRKTISREGYDQVDVALDGSVRSCPIDHRRPQHTSAADFVTAAENIQDGEDTEFTWENAQSNSPDHTWTLSRRGDLIFVRTPADYDAFFRYADFLNGIRNLKQIH